MLYKQIHGFLPENKCQEIVKKVFQLKDSWVTTPIGTSLGLAWYKMLESGLLHIYHAQSFEANLLIHKNFSEFFGKTGIWRQVADMLTDNTGVALVPISIRSRCTNLGNYWGDMGFTIASNTVPYTGIDIDGKEHAPTEYSGVHMDYEGLSPYVSMLFEKETKAYSAIIALELPKEGGGLQIFPRRFLANEYKNDQEYEIILEKEGIKPVALDYRVGTLTVFDSFVPHAISYAKYSEKHPNRIVAVIHYLYLKQPYPHWEYWF